MTRRFENLACLGERPARAGGDGQDAKDARDKRIFALWLACWTQEEIAEEVGCVQGEVAGFIKNGKFADSDKTPSALHQTDFDARQRALRQLRSPLAGQPPLSLHATL